MNDLQAMAEHLGLSKGAVEYIGTDRDIQGILWMSDVVVYASYLNEQAFPPSLVRAMSLQRPVIAPKQATFKEYVSSPLSSLYYLTNNISSPFCGSGSSSGLSANLYCSLARPLAVCHSVQN